MAKRIDFKKYESFVDAVTSDESRDFIALSDRLMALDEQGANIERLMTGAIGINAEGGEVMEIVKKMVFQGKPWNEETSYHLKRELGDCMWYIMQCCIALEVSMDDVIKMNIDKLEKRYPGGQFDAYYSENRETNDI
jgi:NTP pyrophosphatase (non-canonical NTP hydrolase)